MPIYSKLTQEGNNVNIKIIKTKEKVLMLLINSFNLYKRIREMRVRG